MMRRARNTTLFHFFLLLQCFLHEGYSSAATLQNVIPQQIKIAETISWPCNADADCSVTGSSCIDDICQCAKGHTYNANMTSCLKVASAYSDECIETIQCSRYLLEGASCINNICICGEGYYYIHGKCNRYAGLSEKCRKDDDCYVNADFEATSCNNGVCECSKDFYQREYRTCRPAGKAIGEQCTVDIDCTFSKTAVCTKWSCVDSDVKNGTNQPSHKLNRRSTNLLDSESRMGEACTTDKDCNVLKNEVCGHFGTCVCSRGYFVHETSCSPELGEPCKSDDPVTIEYSVCRNGRWACAPGRVPSKDNQICRKVTREYDKSCLHDEQCYIFGPDAYCESKRCNCNKKSRYVEEEMFCWTARAIGETCNKDVDCYVEGMDMELFCTNNVCSCPDGTRPNSGGTACLKASAGLGDTCEVGTDCAEDTMVCTDEICACHQNYYEADGHCVPGINATCENNDGCTAKNSVCTEGICTCEEKQVAVSSRLCLPVSLYGEACEEDVQCSATTPNTVCSSRKGFSEKTCSCMENYRYIFEQCFQQKRLGESCAYRGECYLTSNQNRVVCMNGKCTCDWGYVQANDTVCKIGSTPESYDYNSAARTALGGSSVVLLLIIKLFNPI